MLKKYSELFAGGFFILSGIVIAVQIPSIRLMKVVMDSRLVPKICVVLLIAFGIILLLQGLSLLHRERKASFDNANGRAAAKKDILGTDQTKMVQTGHDGTLLENSNERGAFDKLGKWAGPARAGICLLLFGIFILMLQPFGFILSGIIYLIGSFIVTVPTRKVKSPVLYIIGTFAPIAVYVLFVYAFKVLLPKGTIW
jgi:hypothetical protein